MNTQNNQLHAELSATERHKILVEWNNTRTHYPQDKCIHQLFEAQVERIPNAIAAVFEDQQITYAELNRRANQLAHHLQVLGVKPEVLVGICVQRSLEMIVGLLAILKVGGAYVPLDPSYPKERLAFILADAQVPILVTQEKLVENLPEHRARTVCLETSTNNHSSENPISGVTPENLVYVIYTSGSTGKPKGVLITHRGLCNLTLAQIERFLVQPDSRVLQLVSLSFDVAISDIAMALCSGATLELVNQDSIRSVSKLTQVLRDKSITHLEIPASVLAKLPVAELPKLQTLIVGGEVCSPSVVAQWSKTRRFFNAYGPTEATVCATLFESSAAYRGQLPIGRPIANTQTYILDDHLMPVPIRVAGELHI